MKISIDRSLAIPIAEQIKGQLGYAIACGLSSRGELLPSVRELADTLGVAPVTVSHAYRELARNGLVVTKPGVGTFVADIAGVAEGDRLGMSQENLRQIVDNCLRQGLSLGYTVDDVQSTFGTLADQYRAQGAERLVVVAGNFRSATESYAREIETILHDLNVKARAVLVQDLAHTDALVRTLASAKLVITIPTRLLEVRRLMAARRIRVTAVAFRPSLDTRRKIAAIPSSRRIGLVATFAELQQTMADEVASYGLAKTAPVCAVIDQPEAVRSLLAKIDVLIYASGSEAVLAWLPPGIEAIEFRHAPEPDSVNRLRPLLG